MNFISQIGAHGRPGRILFNILLLVCLLNIFYIPGQYTDRFFTSGMIWLGITIPLFWGVSMLFVGKRLRFPALWLYVAGLMIVSQCYAWGVGTFSIQQLSFMLALCLLLLLLANSGEYLKLEDIYFLLSVVAWAEAILGIAQYFSWYKVYNFSFPVTGTFENPAGLAAYLAFSFPLVFFFVCSKSLLWRIWGIVASGTLFVVIVLSGSRTGMIASVAILFLIVFRHLTLNRKMFRCLLISGFIAGLLFAAALYFLKKDSADGRLLIWRCTWEMIREKPWFGHGPGTFEGQYMVWQARWLSQHTHERWNWLAGDVKHPFNEVLKIASEYGVCGFLAIVILFFWLLWLYKRSGPVAYFLFISLLAGGICGLFSYPLNYPSVWVLLVVVLGAISRESGGSCVGRKWLGGVALICGVALMGFTVIWKQAEIEWYRIAHRSLAGKTEEVLPDYARLYLFMKGNPLFLYNYGAELHELGHWQESIVILKEGINRLNDTDVQLLLADNYLNRKDYQQAEKCLLLASQMCPNRFLPLYKLVNLYIQTGRQSEASGLAAEIVRKPVKVPSYTIKKIKKDMAEYISAVR